MVDGDHTAAKSLGLELVGEDPLPKSFVILRRVEEDGENFFRIEDSRIPDLSNPPEHQTCSDADLKRGRIRMQENKFMTRLTIISVLAASAIALSGCSQSTPYAPQSASATAQDFGYSSQMLAEGLYRVSFAGNQFTARDTVEDYLLYRSAELTRQQGYTGFTLVRENTDRTSSTDVDTYPVTGVGTYATFAPYYGFYGVGGVYNSYDPFVGGAFPSATAVDIDRIERYEATATISMYRGAPPVGAQPNFDASAVISRLQGSVEMPG